MIYRVTYQKPMKVAGKMVIVEEDIQAATFDIKDGVLVLYGDEAAPCQAIPPGLWLGIEPTIAPADKVKLQ